MIGFQRKRKKTDSLAKYLAQHPATIASPALARVQYHCVLENKEFHFPGKNGSVFNANLRERYKMNDAHP